MEMMMEIDKVEAELPGLDCGACGAPSRRAFAEDTVRGVAAASKTACSSCARRSAVLRIRSQI